MADDTLHFLMGEGKDLVLRDAVSTMFAVLPLTSASLRGHTAVGDADYQALVTDVQVGFASLTAPRTVTLPDVDAYPLGQVLFIADESGACSSAIPITISVGAGTSDTIAGQSAIQITDAYQGIGLRRGAANVWIIAR